MKKRNLLALLLLAICLGAVAQPTAPTGKKWQKVNLLSDEFDSFDNSKWQKGHPYWTGRSPSQFNNDNISVGSGNMRITATLKNPDRTGDWVWTGCLTSQTKAFKKGMYAEVRMKAADLAIVSSFWMQGSYSEIDVIENWGEVKNSNWYLDYTMMSNTHYFKDGWANDKITPKHFTNPGNSKNSENYHVFGVWWKDAWTINFYRDGSYVGTATPGGAFEEDMYMFFDMETFTWGPGVPSNADLGNWTKSTAFYDYVRTYELVDDAASTTQKVSLKNQSNNSYVSSENGLQAITCNRSSVGDWEKFEFIDLGNSVFALKGSNGLYVSSENGTKAMTCTRSAIGAWEQFTLEHKGNQIYELKGNNGKYISSNMWCNGNGGSNTDRFLFTWGLKSASIATSAINEDKQAEIKIYPNPANNYFTIETNGIEEGELPLSIYSISGKLCKKQVFKTNSSFQINISDLSPGMYYIKCGSLFNKKLVVK